MNNSALPQRYSLLGIENLAAEDFSILLNNAIALSDISKRDIKKTPALRGKTVINFFCENSTRTKSSFEIAGKWLSADVINVSASSSSIKKGESLLDTMRTFEAMSPDAIVLRHAASGAGHFLSRHTQVPIINAGDGLHEHPTQALLDCLSLCRHFDSGIEGIKGKKIAIVGDVLHSRVARSNIWAHSLLGNQVNLVAPPTFLPAGFEKAFPDNVKVFYDLEEGVAGADVVMVLRLQLERQTAFFIPSEEEYTNEYFVTRELLNRFAAPECVVMHPGPINRGVEVESSLIDSERSLVENQVNSGLAVRMACLMRACLGDAKSQNKDSAEPAQDNNLSMVPEKKASGGIE